MCRRIAGHVDRLQIGSGGKESGLLKRMLLSCRGIFLPVIRIGGTMVVGFHKRLLEQTIRRAGR